MLSLFKSLKKNPALKNASSEPDYNNQDRGNSPPIQDAWAAIDELSKAVKNNPESVENYLALGNLYRSQGEIERAIHIRNSLILRHGLDPKLKARAFFELGRDFKRGGFLDRALKSFDEARKLAGDKPFILLELARLYADSGDYKTACDYYGILGKNIEVAHYLIRQAKDKYISGQPNVSGKLIKKALKTYPGSPEAWLARLIQVYKNRATEKFKTTLRQALSNVDQNLKFLLLEELLQFLASKSVEQRESYPKPIESIPLDVCQELTEIVLPVLSGEDQDVLISYYGGLICSFCGNGDDARIWLEKALMAKPDFWLARLKLLSLATPGQKITPFFKEQLEFFVTKAENVKRFVCMNCGVKRSGLFYVCPRCQSWHSIRFRMEITS